MDFIEDIQKLKAARQHQGIASSPVTLMQGGVDFWRVSYMPLVHCSFLYAGEGLLTWGVSIGLVQIKGSRSGACCVQVKEPSQNHEDSSISAGTSCWCFLLE